MRMYALLLFGQAELFLAQSNTLHKEGHVSGQGPHGLPALPILQGISRLKAVNGVPILAGRHRHTVDGEILVQLVKGGRAAAAAGAHHACADLHGLIKACAVKKAVQHGDEGGVGRGKIHRTCDNKAIRLLQLAGQLIDHIVKHALTRHLAPAAGAAAPNRLIAHLYQLRLHAFLSKDAAHFLQRRGGVAADPGTSVEHQNLHGMFSFLSDVIAAAAERRLSRCIGCLKYRKPEQIPHRPHRHG